MNFSDNVELIESLKEGDEKAYMFLLSNFHRRLNAYALTLVNDQAIAQDIVQNVFIKTWQYRKKLDSNYVLQSFLYKSVYNEFVNNYQKNKAMMVLQYKYLETINHVIEKEDDTSLKKLINTVNKEIENLPPKCQKVFHLSKKEGLTNIEISEHLNVSIKTVEAQITKAYQILRNKLGTKYETLLFILFQKKLKF